MCICLYVHAQEQTYVCMCVYMCGYMAIHAYICINWMYISQCVYVHSYVCIHKQVYTCTHIGHAYFYTYLCTHAYVDLCGGECTNMCQQISCIL